jgi:cell division protein FtsB
MPEETTVKVADLEAANKVIEDLKRELEESEQRNAFLKRAIELMCRGARLQGELMEQALLLKDELGK